MSLSLSEQYYHECDFVRLHKDPQNCKCDFWPQEGEKAAGFNNNIVNILIIIFVFLFVYLYIYMCLCVFVGMGCGWGGLL